MSDSELNDNARYRMADIQFQKQVKSQVLFPVYDRMEDQVSNCVFFQIWASVRDRIEDRSHNQFINQVREQLILNYDEYCFRKTNK
jgi:hypothetical protein